MQLGLRLKTTPGYQESFLHSANSLLFSGKQHFPKKYNKKIMFLTTYTWSSLVPLKAWRWISLKPFPYSMLQQQNRESTQVKRADSALCEFRLLKCFIISIHTCWESNLTALNYMLPVRIYIPGLIKSCSGNSQCQHVIGDSTEGVGGDFSDVGMIHHFPASKGTD